MFNSKLLAQQFKSRPRSLVDLVLKASICHKSELPDKKVKHWPYEKYPYNFATFFLDPFSKSKFNENTKIIQVDGNVASGKHDFARRLADELGMKVMDDVDVESYYINDHGYDYRALNPLLPERMRLCDWEMFHENPSRHSVIHMQNYLFKLRMFQYIRALQHLFNTGQGVILVRSVFTERVFVEAMHNVGWLPKGYLRGDGVQFYDWKTRYQFIRNLCLRLFNKPHLTIYLDRPVDKCMDCIKSSSNPVIAQSRALVPEFLQSIDSAYNDVVLPKMDYNGYVMKVKYPERFDHDELMDVVEDIKELDFTYDPHDTRFESWDDKSERMWHYNQRKLWTSTLFTSHTDYFYQPWYDIAGLGDSISAEDIALRDTLYEGHVANMGFFTSFDRDTRFSNFWSVLIDRTSFKREMDMHLRSDFL